MQKQFIDQWAIILGGSSGFGLAAVEKLAAYGMNIAVLYRETSAADRLLKENWARLAGGAGVRIDAYNLNALEPASRESFIQQFAARAGQKHSVRLLLHSIARGNLKPLAGEAGRLISSPWRISGSPPMRCPPACSTGPGCY